MRRLFVLGALALVACDDNAAMMNGNGDGPPLVSFDLSTAGSTLDLSTPITPKGDMAMLPCTCPSGWSCDGTGACVGGDSSKLPLDVQTIKLSGTVTLNGQPPTPTAACTPTVTEAVVHLNDATRGYQFDIPILCSATSAAFDAVVFPGDYTVTVTGDDTLSNLPKPSFAEPPLSLRADRAGLLLDVKSVKLDGTITLNGAGPTGATQCDATTHVDLTPVDPNGTSFSFSAPCANPLVWSGSAFPGTYTVAVRGVGDVVGASSKVYDVPGQLAATTDQHALALDVQTFNVGGPITLNGSPASMTDCTAVGGAQLTFTSDKHLFTIHQAASCTTNVLSLPSFKLLAGQYDVTIFGKGGMPLAAQTYPIVQKYAVTTNQTNDTFDISTAVTPPPTKINVGGAITLNGVAPVATINCTSKGSVQFVNSKHTTTTFSIPCASSSFTGMLAPDTYDIFVTDTQNGSDLLAPPFPAASGVVLSADKTDFAFDEKTVMVSGRVTLNGMDPATVGTCTTGSTQFEGTVHLTPASGTASFDLRVPCSAGAFAWSGLVYPASYTVSVDGLNGTSSLPDERFKLTAPVDASAGKSGITIDVRTTAVSGKVTLNGMTPSTTTQCNANPNQSKATVSLLNLDQGATFNLPVLCSSADFSWTGVVFPGTYRISVNGGGGYSSLPKNTFLAVPKLIVQ
jgi:hypothetical protein